MHNASQATIRNRINQAEIISSIVPPRIIGCLLTGSLLYCASMSYRRRCPIKSLYPSQLPAKTEAALAARGSPATGIASIAAIGCGRSIAKGEAAATTGGLAHTANAAAGLLIGGGPKHNAARHLVLLQV